jgi:hypothetical protein
MVLVEEIARLLLPRRALGRRVTTHSARRVSCSSSNPQSGQNRQPLSSAEFGDTVLFRLQDFAFLYKPLPLLREKVLAARNLFRGLGKFEASLISLRLDYHLVLVVLAVLAWMII